MHGKAAQQSRVNGRHSAVLLRLITQTIILKFKIVLL